jgi:predicted transcriptional regulator of viral defense system
LSLYQIRDLALESGRAVFSIQQLANLIGKSKAISTVYAFRLVQKGLAWKLLKGKICFEKDDFIIATQLIEPSYISLGSALLFHGITTQVQKNIECVTTKNSFRFKELGIIYHKIPAKLFFGFKKQAKGKSYAMIAEPEKALLDGLYLNVFAKRDLEGLFQLHQPPLGGQLDRKKLREFLKKFSGRGKKKLERIVGTANIGE